MSTKLMEILQFTADDLAYNRKGQLSPQQEALTNKQRRVVKLIVLVVGIILLIITCGWVIIFLQQDETSARIVSVGAGAVIFGLPAIIALYFGLRPMPKKIFLEKFEGKAKVARVEHSYTTGNGRTTHIRTELHIGGKIFPLPDAAFSELEDGAEYTVYAWKGTEHIFSLEKVR